MHPSMYRLIETCILLTFSCINLFTILHASSLMQRQAPHHAMFLQTPMLKCRRTGQGPAVQKVTMSEDHVTFIFIHRVILLKLLRM